MNLCGLFTLWVSARKADSRTDPIAVVTHGDLATSDDGSVKTPAGLNNEQGCVWCLPALLQSISS